MGMTIDEIQQGLKEYHNGFTGCAGNFQEVVDGALDIVCRYQMMELDRKSEMVGMLEELKEQLRKMHEDYFETEHFDEAYGLSDSIAIIEQKIDSIK